MKDGVRGIAVVLLPHLEQPLCFVDVSLHGIGYLLLGEAHKVVCLHALIVQSACASSDCQRFLKCLVVLLGKFWQPQAQQHSIER